MPRSVWVLLAKNSRVSVRRSERSKAAAVLAKAVPSKTALLAPGAPDATSAAVVTPVRLRVWLLPEASAPGLPDSNRQYARLAA
ncbi:MAG: hypothetical protein BWX84_02718 [Verrucomicrobia bacterium ADurb.Bin118]|nr:MAG: hypothetical protein BWX84_02718 [Verrucomicrobia bacterium ADurb.Bin118]